MFQLGLVLLVSSLLGFASPTAFPDYLVIGQQKCGTSTLWALTSHHPQLMNGNRGHGAKEPVHFQHWEGFNPGMKYDYKYNAKRYGVYSERCDRHLMKYINIFPNQQPGNLVGDFTAMHLSCYCCPEVLSQIIPKAKVVVLLRDPVERTLSRFMEQYNWPFKSAGFLEKIIQQYSSFEEYYKDDLRMLKECFDMASNLPEGPNKEHMVKYHEYRCLVSSNVIGWSVYSVFIRRWLQFFPADQFLFIYTSELEADPAGTIYKVETHLGVQHHKYDEDLFNIRFNTKHSYGWAVATKGTEGAGVEVFNHSLVAKAGQGIRQNTERRPDKSAEEMRGNTDELTAFFKPYMVQLQQMVEQGLVSHIPDEMMQPYL